jgi:hypothetical protein
MKRGSYYGRLTRVEPVAQPAGGFLWTGFLFRAEASCLTANCMHLKGEGTGISGVNVRGHGVRGFRIEGQVGLSQMRDRKQGKMRFKLPVALGLVFLLSFATFGAALANGQGNSARSVAEPAVITSVEAEVSDPDRANFEEEFTYYVVRFETIENVVNWTYREPAVRGGNNDYSIVTSGSWSAFWFGVSGPDGSGIQHPVDHKGQVSMYYETQDGDVYSIIAQFNGKGELLHVNGVRPAQ